MTGHVLDKETSSTGVGIVANILLTAVRSSNLRKPEKAEAIVGMNDTE